MSFKRALVGVGLLSAIGAERAQAVELVVEPFLQSMSPESTWVVWEIDVAADSRVEFGVTPDTLDHSAPAVAHASEGEHQIVEAQLTGLTPATRVFYRVVSGDAVGTVEDFVTPPEPGTDTVIRVVAMSDMQRNNQWPGKFSEVVHEGILDWASARWGNDIAGELSMLLIPGDLVENGPNYDEWGQTFFAPLQPLSAHVPIWPVYGNHEQGHALVQGLLPPARQRLGGGR